MKYKFVPGWGSIFRNCLISQLHKINKYGLYKDEINRLKYSNKIVYDEMIDRILKNKKKQWEIDEIKIIIRKAFKNYIKSYNISIINNEDPLIQLNSTINDIEKLLEAKIDELKGVKFTETLENN